jgi:hypothetical protein
MLAFLAVWAAIATATALFMARRGHACITWAIVSAALGPLAWPLAMAAILDDEQRSVAEATDPNDVLVGVAPWIRSFEPILKALRGLSAPIAGVTLVSALDAEDAIRPAGRAAAREAEDRLIRCAKALTSSRLLVGPVAYRLVYGRAADELAQLARCGEYRAIVLGPSGSWLHHLVQGHTRSRLERLTQVPVVAAVSTEVAA